MATYKAYAHIPNDSIATVEIKVGGVGTVHVLTPNNGTWEGTYEEGEYFTFTATAASGYVFDHWKVYTSGGEYLRQSSQNPYEWQVAPGGIWLVPYGKESSGGGGGGEDPSIIWGYSIKKNIGTISTDYSISGTLTAQHTNVYSVSFATAGTVSFYTTGSTDTYGFLSKALDFNENVGGPRSPEAEDDDGAPTRTNFQIDYFVQPNQIYYLWVRGIDEEETGNYVLYITAPVPGGEEPPTGDGGVYIYVGGWKKATPYIYTNGWKKATPDIYDNGWKKCL